MYEIVEKEKRMGLQEAIRQHRILWGRYKFIHAKYLPPRFKKN